MDTYTHPLHDLLKTLEAALLRSPSSSYVLPPRPSYGPKSAPVPARALTPDASHTHNRAGLTPFASLPLPAGHVWTTFRTLLRFQGRRGFCVAGHRLLVRPRRPRQDSGEDGAVGFLKPAVGGVRGSRSIKHPLAIGRADLPSYHLISSLGILQHMANLRMYRQFVILRHSCCDTVALFLMHWPFA